MPTRRDWSQIFTDFMWPCQSLMIVETAVFKKMFLSLSQDVIFPKPDYTHRRKISATQAFAKLFGEVHLRKLEVVILIMISTFMWPQSCTGMILTLLQYQHQNTNFTWSWPWVIFWNYKSCKITFLWAKAGNKFFHCWQSVQGVIFLNCTLEQRNSPLQDYKNSQFFKEGKKGRQGAKYIDLKVLMLVLHLCSTFLNFMLKENIERDK